MGCNLPRTLPEHHCSDEVMADRFLEHFTDKITSIRQRLNQPSDAQAARSAIDNERNHTLSELSPASTFATCRLVQTCPSKQCCLDPLPTSINVESKYQRHSSDSNAHNQSVARICNGSNRYETCSHLSVLKKTSLHSNELVNYRPISNLSFVSKLLERHIAADLDENTLLDPFQSAYRPRHSTEIALVCIHDDILQALDRNKGIIYLFSSTLRLPLTQ